MPTEFLHKVTYTTEGATDLTITMPYLLPEHIFVLRAAAGQVAGEELYVSEHRPGAWDFLDTNTIRLATPIALGEQLVIIRQTKIDKRMVDYANGAQLGEEDLNSVTKQLLFLIQEIGEVRVDGYGFDPSDPGGGGLITEPEIDTIINELLNRQTFLNLIELIPLMDINAELIISESLKQHKDWLIDGDFGYKLDETGTKITFLEDQQVTQDAAFATYKTTIAARFGDSEASIVSLLDTRVTATTAYAGIQTELQAKLPSAELEDRIVLSSYVNGVKATADTNLAEIAGIESYLVGIGDFLNPAPGSLGDTMSIMQNTVNGHAGRLTTAEGDILGLDAGLSTSITWRTALGSYFNWNDPGDGAGFASAIESKWKTYADSESTTATRVTTLESNQSPLFFQALPPNTADAAYAGTDWSTAGFPGGSMWYELKTGNKMTPYMYSQSFVNAAFDAGIGYWIAATDDDLSTALGAKIQTVEETIVGPGGVIADLTTTLQAVYGGNITNIEEWLEAYIKPPTVENPDGGIMYSGYGVRANQYLVNGPNGTPSPVMAGFGFGIQSDPWNPDNGQVSDFIVMADNFAIIAPPSIGTVLEGVFDQTTIKVPFFVDTSLNPPEVVINGNLFVRGTLRAYEGGLTEVSVGQIEAGQMTSNIELFDPAGIRCGLYSSTGNNWTSNTASPFPGGSNPQEFLIWAGEGLQKNDANAIFYVDTDGNAKFTGEVAADNITGDLSTAKWVTHHPPSNQTANSTSLPVWLTNSQGETIVTLATSSSRPKRPVAMMNVNMLGTGQFAGKMVMEMRWETSPTDWTIWTRVTDNIVELSYGGRFTLMGGLPNLVNYGVQLRIGILQHDGYSPQSSGYDGVVMLIS